MCARGRARAGGHAKSRLGTKSHTTHPGTPTAILGKRTLPSRSNGRVPSVHARRSGSRTEGVQQDRRANMLRLCLALTLASAQAQVPRRHQGPSPSGPSPSGCANPPCAAPLLGDVGLTSVGGVDLRTGNTFLANENIYGPFENGFGSAQDNILAGLGCSPGSLGHVIGGIDTRTAEQMVAQQCSITLPRIEGNSYISLLDECGGHTNEYHFHERMSCLYDGQSNVHSIKVGDMGDGKPLYGKWEAPLTLPALDACGGHFGVTPDSNNGIICARRSPWSRLPCPSPRPVRIRNMRAHDVILSFASQTTTTCRTCRPLRLAVTAQIPTRRVRRSSSACHVVALCIMAAAMETRSPPKRRLAPVITTPGAHASLLVATCRCLCHRPLRRQMVPRRSRSQYLPPPLRSPPRPCRSPRPLLRGRALCGSSMRP